MLILTGLFVLLFITAHAQISPGKLTSAHAELEGISNCTQCHDLGKQVSSAKCLDCHTEIQQLIDTEHGYHASKEVVGQECFECHSEHHGKRFEMSRFDEDQFDHQLTGYTLEGQHDVIECRECHQPEYITDPEIRKLEDTFLGLVEDCKSCHEDYHQGTLTHNNDCAACHDIMKFRPAPYFDHDQDSQYPLTGKHIEVDCEKCHPIGERNGAEFQEFTGMAFDDCIACHDDAHHEQLVGTCTQCHEEASFASFTGQQGFDHQQTSFTLKGKHSTVACFECHQYTSDALQVFQDHAGIGQNQCIACHDDAHEGKFGNDCAQCHNEESWFTLQMDEFNHDLTDYPLIGKHIPVDCKECHTTPRYTDPIDFSACMNCHEDYHQGEFAVNGISPDCAECHSVTAGFEETTYTFEQHAETDFPLEGAHLATPCFACHLSEEQWAFRDIPSDCKDCHDDVHNGQFADAGSTDCARCHDAQTWFPSLFDHDNTDFALEGRHAEVECAACHKPYEEEGQAIVEYKIKRFECVDCHL